MCLVNGGALYRSRAKAIALIPISCSVAQTNVLFLRVCAIVYVTIALGAATAFTVYATTRTGLFTYRILSVIAISAEMLGYCW